MCRFIYISFFLDSDMDLEGRIVITDLGVLEKIHRQRAPPETPQEGTVNFPLIFPPTPVEYQDTRIPLPVLDYGDAPPGYDPENLD